MPLSLPVATLLAGVGAPFAAKAADKFLPVSTPSGRKLGADASDFYDQAFPGTSPWERLGTQNPASAQVAARSQQRIANRQIGSQAATALGVAKINAQAQVDSANIAAGKDPTDLQLSQIELNEAQASQAKSMVSRLGAATRRDLAQLVVDNKRAEFADRLVKAGIYADEANRLSTLAWTVINEVYGAGEKGVQAAWRKAVQNPNQGDNLMSRWFSNWPSNDEQLAFFKSLGEKVQNWNSEARDSVIRIFKDIFKGFRFPAFGSNKSGSAPFPDFGPSP